MRPILGGYPRRDNRGRTRIREPGPRRLSPKHYRRIAPLVGTRKLCYHRPPTSLSSPNAFTLQWREEMDTSAASGNTFSKVVFGLAAVLLVFAPPTRRSCGDYPRFADLQRIFCALRRLDLHADRKADRGQYHTRRHCEFPRGGLHVSGHSRSVDRQLERGQYARFLRSAGTGSNLVGVSDQTEHPAGAHQLGSDPARGRNTGAGLPGEPQSRKSVCAML
jgi:hypothetical protein